MSKSLKFFYHLCLFVSVEFVFAILIFHQLPSFSVVTTIWIVHIVYFLSIIIAWFVRESVQGVWSRFFCTYTPILFHVLWHIFVAEVMIEEALEHQEHWHNMFWTITATIIVGILIAIWERLLHRKEHCDVCHKEVHQNCKQE